jgi:hypothetical protein
VWRLGNHRIGCADARDPASFKRLMGQNRAAMAFLDPPYNRPVKKIVGRGRTKYEEFKIANGEMSASEFTVFLKNSLGLAAEYSTKDATLGRAFNFRANCAMWGYY